MTLRELLNMMMVKQSKLLSESGFQRVFWVEMNIFAGFFFLENFCDSPGHISGWS